MCSLAQSQQQSFALKAGQSQATPGTRRTENQSFFVKSLQLESSDTLSLPFSVTDAA